MDTLKNVICFHLLALILDYDASPNANPTDTASWCGRNLPEINILFTKATAHYTISKWDCLRTAFCEKETDLKQRS